VVMAVCHAQVPKVCKETQRSFVPREERGGGGGGTKPPLISKLGLKTACKCGSTPPPFEVRDDHGPCWCYNCPCRGRVCGEGRGMSMGLFVQCVPMCECVCVCARASERESEREIDGERER
jgi:hypothetical protein